MRNVKKNGKYRYSLQFSANSNEEIKAGELLERLGNKKSVVIVAALNEYLASHPDLERSHGKIEVKMYSSCKSEHIEEMIQRIVEEKLRLIHIEECAKPSEETKNELEIDVAQMLENLDLFQ